MIKAIPTLVIITCTLSFCRPLFGQSVIGKWSGTVRSVETYSGITGKSEMVIIVNINDNVATGTVTQKGQRNVVGTYICNGNCSGSGPAELHDVSINLAEQKYWIEVISPRFNCVYTGTGCEVTEAAMDAISIGASNQPLANSPNSLIGSETSSFEIPGGYGTVTKSVTWNLTRRFDVELIVTPANYDNWLPEPGKNEITPGTVMNINLKLQKSNGQPPTIKAKAFELRLNNTSKEPGITINAPINPLVDLPDLRFKLQTGTGVQMAGDFQVLKINCNNCTTASAVIESFDGGGYTTLTVIAILEDDTEVGGRLLVSGGIREIPIPKRAPGSNIGQAWLIKNGDPAETDDKDASKGNKNDGDGLSAYEEYRGVISATEFSNHPSKFGRLDPKKKELGVRMKRGEVNLFTPGIRMLETEADIKVIRFNENEIGDDRRLNKNIGTSHIYKQYAVKLESVHLEEGVVGRCEPKEVTPKVPELAVRVAVDVDQMARVEAQYVVNGTTGPNSLQDEIASTAAHELAHAVGISHHGPGAFEKIEQIYSRTDIVLKSNGDTIRLRPYPLGRRSVGKMGSVESGDLSCFMTYNEYYTWAINARMNHFIVAEVPPIPVGKKLCKNADGTGINGRPNYFYSATNGNCLSKMKFKR